MISENTLNGGDIKWMIESGIENKYLLPYQYPTDEEIKKGGLEIVDLLAEAVQQVRSDRDLSDCCLKNGLVFTMYKEEGFGSRLLNSWLKEMQRNKMLRLFGIAETDGGKLFVSEHAKK